jgi:hypothetical protein
MLSSWQLNKHSTAPAVKKGCCSTHQPRHACLWQYRQYNQQQQAVQQYRQYNKRGKETSARLPMAVQTAQSAAAAAGSKAAVIEWVL